MTVQKIFLGLGAIFVVCIGLTIGIYAFNFRDLSISSSDPAPWAQFGAYVTGMLSPAFALINLLVVTYIAIRVKELQETQLSSKRLTLDLYKEWHEEKLHKSRIEVSGLISENKKLKTPLPMLSAMERDEKGKTTGEHAFRVYHFFEKCAVLAHAREIDTRLLVQLLGTYIEWWRDEFFAQMLKGETDRYMKTALELMFKCIFDPTITSGRGLSAQPGAAGDVPQAARP